MAKNDFVIEFKLMKSSAEELKGLYAFFLTSYISADQHECLLSEHIKDMYIRLERLVDKMDKTARLRMNNSEALAFFQTWSIINLSIWPLTNVLVKDMLQKIDKRIKAPKEYARN